MAPDQRRRDLVLVSAGLGLDGGGRAAAGRLLAAAAARFAADEGLGFEILHLGQNGYPGQTPTRICAHSHVGLARAVWGRQLCPRRPALLFDLLGPARSQAFVPRRLRSPYLVYLYGVDVWQHLSWDRQRALAQATVRLASSAHTVREARHFISDLPPVEILHLALEERRPEGELDTRLLEQVGEGFLLIVARMSSQERYKGHDELLGALPPVVASRPDTRLVVVGDGDDRPRLEAKATALGLGRRVFFTGFVSEATRAKLYRRSVAFVMPSRGEGFGLVYLEAMRAGKPCVAALGGAAAEILQEGKSGLLVDPEDPQELATALLCLLSDPDFVRQMGAAGRRRWQERFSCEGFHQGLRPYLERLTRI